jgi:hypothetical protein
MQAKSSSYNEKRVDVTKGLGSTDLGHNRKKVQMILINPEHLMLS